MAHQEAGPAGGPSYFGMEVSERDWAGVRAPGPRERFTEKVMADRQDGPAGGPSYFGMEVSERDWAGVHAPRLRSRLAVKGDGPPGSWTGRRPVLLRDGSV